MIQKLVKNVAAFAVIAGVTVMVPAQADAGLFGKCGGGLFGKFKGKHAANDCCAPAPVCCEPAPAPVCCEPAPEPVCCEPAPAPVCCEAAPAPVSSCCGETSMVESAAPVATSSCCGDSVIMGDSTMSTSGEGYDLAPGETLVPGSVMTAPAADAGAAAAAPAAEAAAEPAADAAAEPAASSSDAEVPPAPTPDANSDI